MRYRRLSVYQLAVTCDLGQMGVKRHVDSGPLTRGVPGPGKGANGDLARDLEAFEGVLRPAHLGETGQDVGREMPHLRRPGGVVRAHHERRAVDAHGPDMGGDGGPHDLVPPAEHPADDVGTTRPEITGDLSEGVAAIRTRAARRPAAVVTTRCGHRSPGVAGPLHPPRRGQARAVPTPERRPPVRGLDDPVGDTAPLTVVARPRSSTTPGRGGAGPRLGAAARGTRSRTRRTHRRGAGWGASGEARGAAQRVGGEAHGQRHAALLALRAAWVRVRRVPMETSRARRSMGAPPRSPGRRADVVIRAGWRRARR